MSDSSMQEETKGGKERFNETLDLFMGLNGGKKGNKRKRGDVLWGVRRREETQQTLGVKKSKCKRWYELNSNKSSIVLEQLSVQRSKTQISLYGNVMDYYFPDAYDFPHLDN